MKPASRARWQDVRINIAAHPVAWPLARALRRLGPVVRVPGLGVVVNDAALAHAVLVNDAAFVKRGPGGVADLMTAAFGPSALANMDGDPHRALRQRLGPLATPDVAERWFAMSRAPLDEAVARLTHGEAVDLATTARRLSGRLTLSLLGLDGDDAAANALHALGERIAAALRLAPAGGMRARDHAADIEHLAAMARHAWHRRDPAPDTLVARLHDLACTEEEARGILSIFFVAGALTLGVALPRVIGLLIDADQLHPTTGDPQRVVAAVEEGLRFTCPVPATLRFAVDACIIGGRAVPRGTRVLVLTSNLGRDAHLFPDPDRFDATRQPNPRARYLWYGAGPHFCLGFPLAQRVLQHGVAAIASVPPTLRVVHRRATRRVLLPAWATLVVGRSRA